MRRHCSIKYFKCLLMEMTGNKWHSWRQTIILITLNIYLYYKNYDKYFSFLLCVLSLSNDFLSVSMFRQNNLNVFLKTLGSLQMKNVQQLSWRTKLLSALIPQTNKHSLLISLTFSSNTRYINMTLKFNASFFFCFFCFLLHVSIIHTDHHQVTKYRSRRKGSTQKASTSQWIC